MLHLSQYLIKENISFLKLSDTYDIFDPNTGKKVGYAKENIHTLLKLLRLVVNKSLLPTRVDVINEREEILFSIKKRAQFIKAKVDILDSEGNSVGFFVSKILSIGGAFQIFDKNSVKIADVKGDWKGWNFKFFGTDAKEIGTITKKWAGIGKEFFTSADNYLINITDPNPNPAKSILLLAAGLAVDIVYKEKQ